MKIAISFFAFLVSFAMASPVPIDVDNFATESFTGSSSLNGTTITITNSSIVNFQDQTNPGNASISISNNSILNFAETSSTVYSGVLSGSGTVNKTGSGDLTMSGNNAGFTGPLFVQAGTLFLGAYGGSVTTSPSATVIYNGPVSGDITVTGHITTNGPSTFVVGGNYTQTPSGTYIVNLSSSGQSSRINVGGIANIAGSVQIDASFGILLNSTYTILHANGGVFGTYGLINPYPLFLTFLTQDANNVYLFLENNILSAPRTPNEQQVAEQFANLVPSSPDEITVMSSLLTLRTLGEAQNALNQLSGEHYTSLILSALYESGRFSKRIYNSFRDIVCPCAEPCESINNWISGGGGKGSQEGDKQAAGFHLSTWDINTGMHACLSDEWLLGGALRYDRDFVESNLGGRGALQTGSGAIYALFHKNIGYIFSDLIGGTTWGEFKRPINFGTLDLTAHSDPRLSYGRIDLQVGADFSNQHFSLQPYVAGSGEIYHQEKIKEKKADSINLLIRPITKKLLSSQLGLHFGSNYNSSEFKKEFSITLDLSWLHYFGNLRVNENVRFQEFGNSFPISGPERGHDGGECSLYFFKPFANSSEFFLGAEGELWRKWHAYEFNAGVCLRW